MSLAIDLKVVQESFNNSMKGVKDYLNPQKFIAKQEELRNESQPQVAVEQPIDNTQVLDADTMATLYNTEQGKNRDIWIKNYTTLEPKTDQQSKELRRI